MSEMSRWNNRRLELLAKGELSVRDRQELKLMEKCVNYMAETAPPARAVKASIKDEVIYLQRTLQELRQSMAQVSEMLGVEANEQ